jgi:hypothetical protein
MKNLTALLLAIAVVGCGGQGKETKPAGPAASSQTNAYLKGLDARFDGDTRAYYDGLLELAHDDPDSRAGRKARAVLQSDSGLWVFASLASLGAAWVPSYSKYNVKSKQAEARAQLMSLYTAQSEHFAATKKYCRTFKECAFAAELSSYTLYMTPTETLTPPDEIGFQADVKKQALARVNVKPHVEKKRFLAAAVANLDEDGDVDIWTVDETGNIVHIVSDVE